MRMLRSFCTILLACCYVESHGMFPGLSYGVRVRRNVPLLRHKRSPTVMDRASCSDNVNESPSVVNTTKRLEEFRAEINSRGLHAYIVPMDDNHQSEYVSEHDKRIQFISGFSGSAGQAIVTSDKAALWTDGRYFLQAELELDCNWIIMQQGEPGVPQPEEWLIEELDLGNSVGADPSLLSYDKWTKLETSLSESSKEINLNAQPGAVDDAWEESGIDRPPRPANNLIILENRFAGEEWPEKIARLRAWMGDSAKMYVVTALDETAWLFNLRGSDIPYNPVFFAFSIVEMDQITLYLNDLSRVTDEVEEHLKVNQCSSPMCVTVKDYDLFLTEIEEKTDGLQPDDKVWVSPMSSYAVYEQLGGSPDARKTRAFLKPSAVRIMKGRKNHQEIEGLKVCHKRDSVAVIEFLTKLEREVKEGKPWNELTAAAELVRFRSEKDYFQSESFAPISASGPNGAVIHYKATEETNRDITTSDMYLLDSGGQYLDGTTDVTRTLHFGTPTDFQKEAYTRVLMGVIDLATTIWANGTYGRDIDAIARAPLWRSGLDYRHGTGHGIGAFLNVHEGPARIAIGYRATYYERPMYGEMFFSDEPGYYEDGEFGIRLETIVMTKKVDLPYQFGGKDYLGFEAFTLVPFEPNLIKYELLTKSQLQWLNEYNARVLQEIGVQMLLAQGLDEEYEWVKRRTEHIEIDESLINLAPSIKFSIFSLTGLIALFMIRLW